MTNFNQDFEFDDLGSRINFDFRGLIFKIFQNWVFIIISILIALSIAYFINVRQQNIYRLNALVSVETEQNPFFTSNTSISFNWGGVNGKIGKVMTTLATRSHNELVVDSLQFYKKYLKQGKYHLLDVYKASPYNVKIEKSKLQLLNVPIEIKTISDAQFKLLINFEDSKSVTCQRYSDKKIETIKVSQEKFEAVFNFNEPVVLPFFNATVSKVNSISVNEEDQYFVEFLNFDAIVSKYQNSVAVSFFKSSSTVLSLAQSGFNKTKIVDYLNTTVAILRETELKTKNLYATNTIAFIDSSLNAVNDNLKDVNEELNDFRSSNKVFDVTEEIGSISERLRIYESQQEIERSKINYLKNLENYLSSSKDYTKIVAPTSVGIEEFGLLNSIAKLTELAITRQNQEKTAREGSILLRRLDSQIDAEKNVTLELITAARRGVNLQLSSINGTINKLTSELKKLPKEQQQFLKIQRKLNINQDAYNVYQTKRSEAAIVKAANVSDISMIDAAKDVGNGPVGPRKSLNYMIGLIFGFIVPVLILFIRFLLDNTIQNTDDVERLSKIPIIGLIGKYNHDNNLVAFEKPKSPVAESFRAIRTSLKFLYKKTESETSTKVLMFTSSVSGEGKTFSSINTATVYALTGKKTVLVGLDLRKPKIFEDFEVTNDKGAVNYLINDSNLDDVVINTKIPNLDLILSGPIPPNPSELLMGDRMDAFIEDLKANYDLIILDTPPLGLVTDALELSQYADATIFMLRLNYTKKGMLSMINSKVKKGELKNLNFLINFYRYKNSDNYGYGYGYGSYGDTYHEKDKLTLASRIKKIFNIS